MNHPNRFFLLALSFTLFCFGLVGLPGRAPAQRVPGLSGGPAIPPIDLADVPLNRPGPERLRQSKDHFFPTLLGLRSVGARQIRTKHFYIYFTSAENTARRIAKIADEVFEDISRHYPTSIERYAPIHVVVDEGVDVLGNAFAIYNNNFIHFWATPLDWEIRGTKDWVRDVFTHELTHIITLKSAHLGWPFTLGILNSSQANQNPDFFFTVPLYHLVAPSWFVEGIAQYESKKHGGDTWDTHRRMLLRMAVLENDLLSYTNMGVFGKDGHHSEMVYNQGYAFLLYIEETYGEDKVRALVEDRPWVNFKSSIKNVLGISADRLYGDWVQYMNEKYGALAAEIRSEGEREGDIFYDGGSVEYHPVYSPDGSRVAFLSNDGADYNLTNLMVMDLSTRQVQTVARWKDSPLSLTSNRFCWTPDGTQIVYVASVGGRWDLVAYDLNRKKSRRLTIGLRGKDPSISPDGQKIVFVGNSDGTTNLGIVNIDGTRARYITNNNDGTQYYSPRWSPDGKRILFSIFRDKDRDIAVINANAEPKPKKHEKSRRAGKSQKPEPEPEPGPEPEPEPDFAPALAAGDAQAETGEKSPAEPDTAETAVEFPDSLAYADNAGFEALIHSAADERDPVWLPDGSGFIFSSDRTGVFNLYSHDLVTGRREQITNVVGGAFAPAISPDGQDIVYAGFHAANYSLYRIGRSQAVEVAAAEAVPRDYRNIYTGDEISDIYDVGRYGPRLTSYGFVPIVLLGPTFIGNRFGLDQLSFGGQYAWGDLLGDDIFVTGFTLGKNLKKNIDLNSDFSVYYETGLSPIFSEQRVFAPRFFTSFGRQTINSLVELGVVATRQDTLSGTLITVIDSQQVLIPNTQQRLNLKLTEDDEFKDVFTDFAIGTEIGLGGGHSLSLMYLRRSYSENLKVTQTVLDSSRIFQRNAEGQYVDITDQIPNSDPTADVVVDDFLYRDLTFYKSNDFAASWSYASFTPAKDTFVNPSGGRALTFRYRRINATVTDSLAFSTDLNQDNVPDPTETDVSPTLFREDNVKFGLNEFLGSWNEFIGLPGRSTLALQTFVGYRDMPIKDVQQNGGTFEGVFYYPLRYYLGGLGTLRGFPYFSASGGKVFFGRANFTFPIFQKADKELPPFFFDKIYGTLFIETGATGNFNSLSDWWDSSDRFKRDAFLVDYGFELRIQMFSTYRLPMFGFFQYAAPMEVGRVRRSPTGELVIPNRNNPALLQEIDERRFYFGFAF